MIISHWRHHYRYVLQRMVNGSVVVIALLLNLCVTARETSTEAVAYVSQQHPKASLLIFIFYSITLLATTREKHMTVVDPIASWARLTCTRRRRSAPATRSVFILAWATMVNKLIEYCSGRHGASNARSRISFSSNATVAKLRRRRRGVPSLIGVRVETGSLPHPSRIFQSWLPCKFFLTLPFHVMFLTIHLVPLYVAFAMNIFSHIFPSILWFQTHDQMLQFIAGSYRRTTCKQVGQLLWPPNKSSKTLTVYDRVMTMSAPWPDSIVTFYSEDDHH